MKPVLDPCCGSRMFWFDRQNPLALFGDIREETHTLCDGRVLEIKPDVQMDFRNLPFQDGTFHLVAFDPPHLVHAGKQSWLALKYGRLSEDWRHDIRKGFEECFRVLKPYGTLVFKWDEDQVKLADVLKLSPLPPLFGNRRPKNSGAHWLVFLKG
ncbi:MAG: class I SAM-dependent methyltransferase [Oxalobacter formigenes]|nr:class I SAM-dependent methyltransferase [Oxalobacter formigenes]